MYFLSIVLLMVVLPVASVLIEWAATPDAGLVGLIGKWFVFWGVGWRLLTAGLKQMERSKYRFPAGMNLA